MRTFEQLQELWKASPAPPVGEGTVVALAVRVAKLENELADQVEITVDGGIAGDRWGQDEDRTTDRQISLMNARAAELVCDGEHPLSEPGDNLVVDFDVSEAALPVGTRLRAGTALLEVTPEPHKGCKKFSTRFGPEALRWVNLKDQRPYRFRGVYCKVIEAGSVRVGDTIAVVRAGD